jgi:SNF2 family DNA or RNA helicase
MTTHIPHHELTEFKRSISDSTSERPGVPEPDDIIFAESLSSTPLLEHQKRIIEWFLRNIDGGGILAADMGTGKTLCFLSVALDMLSDFEAPSLIVAPASIIHNIQNDFRRHFPDYSVPVILHGSSRHKVTLESNIYITSYETLRYDYTHTPDHPIFNFPWYNIFADEAHYFRNKSTGIYHALSALKSTVRWAITATPVINSSKDINNISTWVNFSVPVPPSWFEKHYLHLAKVDVLPSLPSKTFHTHILPFTPQQYEGYLVTNGNALRVWNEHRRREFATILTQILFLKLASVHQDLLLKDKGKSLSVVSSNFKFDRVLQLHHSVHDLIVFSQYACSIHLLSKFLASRSIPHLIIDGSVKNKSLVVQEYQKTGGLILINIHAGGVGINLTRAHHCCFLDFWWNSPIQAQAIDRIHRIGQTHKVHVHFLVSPGIEFWILSRQKLKAHVAHTDLTSYNITSNSISPSNISPQLVDAFFSQLNSNSFSLEPHTSNTPINYLAGIPDRRYDHLDKLIGDFVGPSYFGKFEYL